jgi:leucyl-tRNA synthetase
MPLLGFLSKLADSLVHNQSHKRVFQINGKVRDKIEANSGLSQADAEKLVKESAKIKNHLEGKQVHKIIYIPNKIINIVV